MDIILFHLHILIVTDYKYEMKKLGPLMFHFLLLALVS